MNENERQSESVPDQDENEYMDIEDLDGDYLEPRAGETSEYEDMQLTTFHSNTHVRGKYISMY